MKALSKRFGGSFLIAAMLLSPGLFADTAHVAEDAHIDLGNPDDNNGVVPNLVVSNIVEKRTGERLAFVAYELPALPAGASLEQAFLRLFVGKVATPGDIDLYLVTEAWDEHGISGETAPDFDVAPFATFAVSADDEGHFISVDVTPEVMDWLDGVEPNHGFMLMGNPVMDVDVSFDSKENGQTGHQSELELVLGNAVGGIDSEDIADGSIGTPEVDKDAIQLRVTGTCAAGSSIREIDNLGGVTCEPDDDSGGDITSVHPIAGGGLEGGADSGPAELGIAPGGVTGAMVADGTIGSADVDKSAVQLRVGGSCPAGSSIRSIADDGTVTCETDDDTDTTLDPGLFWQVDGNAGTSPVPGGTNFLGTTDDTELVLGVNGIQAMRLAYGATELIETVNVLGGHPINEIADVFGATIGGGGRHTLSGGTDGPNRVEGSFGTIGGGYSNQVLDFGGFIGGGGGNRIQSDGNYAVIGGGLANSADGLRATIAGGERNVVDGWFAAIGGGKENEIYSGHASIGGGERNAVCDPDKFPEAAEDAFLGSRAVIAGGLGNDNCAFAGFIGGGGGNEVSGEYAAIVGGKDNLAVGAYSVIVGGRDNRASAPHTFAGGFRAVAAHEGAFVWTDSANDPTTIFQSQRPNQVRMRAEGGVRFDVGDDAGTVSDGNQWVEIRTQARDTLGNNPEQFRLIDTSTGAYLSLGGGWVNASDRNRKTDIRDVDANWILEQVAAMPVQTWRYKVEGEEIRHIGPMAQDFHAAFGLGGDPKGIMSVDADGVALAAIQALYRVTRELDARTRQLEAQQDRLDALEASLQALEARLDPFEDRRLVRAQVRLEAE